MSAENQKETGMGTPDMEEDFMTLGALDDGDDNNDSSSSSDSSDDLFDDDDGDQKDEKSYDPTRDLPPWMPYLVNYQRTNRVVALHNEIVGFCKLMEPRENEMKQRNDLVDRFKKLAEKTFRGCQVDVFGSQATGLCLPSSDIDIAIQLSEKDNQASDPHVGKTVVDGKIKITKEQELRDMENWDAPSGTPLERLAEALRDEWFEDMSYLEVIANTRVPLVKFTHAPTNIQVDVCFNQKTGVQAAQLMHRYMDALPPLRPLTFVLKYFLAARGTNQPYSGGMGSFMLQMMIVSFLQNREREFAYTRMPPSYNLGSLLIDFFELYSMDFNYVTVGVSVRFDGYYFPKGATDRKDDFWQPHRPFCFAMENPFEPEMDVGASSFRMSTIHRSFEIAFKIILTHVTEPATHATSILASILPPTAEMKKRALTMQTKFSQKKRYNKNVSSHSPPKKRRRR